jgi:hypothetical protein
MYKKNIGSFKTDSRVLIVSDPCRTDKNFYLTLDAAKGKFNASVLIKEGVVAELSIVHTNHGNRKTNRGKWLYHSSIPVDSGLAGFYDKLHFRNRKDAKGYLFSEPPIDPYDKWYSMNCDIQKAGIIPFGCVSSTGIGDGIYGCYVKKNKIGKVVAAKVVFY